MEDMKRRDFLKVLGGAGVAAAVVAAGCKHPNEISAEGFSEGEVPTDKMTYRKDTHGEKVSLLGYGCMRLPVVDENAEDKVIDQEMVNKETDYAIAHGMTYFDTAPVYCKGKSEHAVGVALSRHKRNEFTIATKLSNFSNWTRENSIAMYKNSFKELQVDYIDYYLLHSLAGGIDKIRQRFIDNEMVDFLMKEREAGRIRNLGFSFHGTMEELNFMLDMHEKVHWDFVQIQMNYVDWRHAEEQTDGNTNAEKLYNALNERNIPVVIMEPLLGGRLASLPDHEVEKLKAREPQKSIASWAFRFCGSHEGVMTILSGMTYMEHLQDNLRTLSPLEPLNEEEYALLEDIASSYIKYPIVPCTGCQYCMPCPYGLNIPKIFAHYNKGVNEGWVGTDKMDPEYRKARRSFLVGYDRTLERERQADHCIGCGQCMEHCPQKIQIPEMMKMIDGVTEKFKTEK